MLCLRRAARQRDTLLAWPEPVSQSVPYWECMRYSYCGTLPDVLLNGTAGASGTAAGEGAQSPLVDGHAPAGESSEESSAPSERGPPAAGGWRGARQEWGRVACYPAASW